MTFGADGSIICDTCQVKVTPGSNEAETLALAMAMRWGVFAGATNGGEPVEYAICPKCRGESRKRPVKKSQDFEDTPLFEEM